MHLIQNQIGGMESMPTVIIGGGQAGLVMGYHLQKVGEQFLILDAQPRIGDSWRNRWDSLRLFSTPRYSSLPGWPMRLSTWPTHIEMGDYLEDYARHFDLPVRSGVRVNRLSRTESGFRLETSHGVLRAERVVIATGGYQTPVVPDFAAELTPRIRQLHSDAYRNPEPYLSWARETREQRLLWRRSGPVTRHGCLAGTLEKFRSGLRAVGLGSWYQS
jgi:putative flavoprotein involved in K+ transport